MRRLLFSILAMQVMMAVPSEAHRLILFARSDAGTIKGYGFFSGGGRAKAAEIVITDATGKEVHRMKTAEDGTFSWKVDRPGTYQLLLNAGDGHVARSTIAFGASGKTPPMAPVAAAEPSVHVADENLEAMIEKAVDRAVERRIEPLREAIVQQDAKLRFKDIISGIAAIIGMAGAAMWALAWKARR